MSKKEFDKAYKLFDTAFQNSLKLNSESPNLQAFDGKLRSLLGAKKYDQLLAEATKHLEGPIATIAYARMARAKADTGDKDTATQYFRRALEKAGTDEGFIIETIKQMNQVVGFDETVKWCNEKIQTQPDSLAINLALLNLYRMSEEYNKALVYADACVKLTTDNEQLNVLYRQNKANTLQMAFKKTGDKDYLKKTIQEYESILKKQPTNATVLNNLAYLLADTGIDISRALDYAKKTYEALPSNANVLDTYGYVLLKSGDAKQANEVLQRALQQFEQDKINAPMEVYDHIGLVKEKLGQDAEALAAYKRALELSNESVSKDVKDRISASIKKLSGQ
jgi:tetratricopeptide (TPR) repeat protein